jgi:hypothetical protein
LLIRGCYFRARADLFGMGPFCIHCLALWKIACVFLLVQARF